MSNFVLPGARYKEIEDAANNLLLKLSDINPPYNLEEVAMQLGVRVVKLSTICQEKREKLAAKLLRTGSDAFLALNMSPPILVFSDLYYERRNYFTLAHEIGHIVLGHLEQSALAEYEANIFARCLLMPFGIIRTFDVDQLLTMDFSEFFHVSNEAARYCLDRSLKRLLWHEDDVSESTEKVSNKFLKTKKEVLCEKVQQ